MRREGGVNGDANGVRMECEWGCERGPAGGMRPTPDQTGKHLRSTTGVELIVVSATYRPPRSGYKRTKPATLRRRIEAPSASRGTASVQ